MKYKHSKFLNSLILLGLATPVFYLFCLPVLIQSYESKSWPKVEAAVISSYINTRAGSDNDLSQLHFEASYLIDGQEYTTNKRYLNSEWAQSWTGDLNDFVRLHPEGSRIPIYYNPSQPEESTIQTGFMPRYSLILVFCLVFFGIGFWLLYRAINKPAEIIKAPSSSEEPDRSMGIERF